jgi:hypothetical protein
MTKAKQLLRKRIATILTEVLPGVLIYLVTIVCTVISLPFIQNELPELSNKAFFVFVSIQCVIFLIVFISYVVISRIIKSK